MNRVISVLKTSALISSLAAGGHAVHYFSEQAKGKNDHPKVEIAPVEHPQEGLQRLLAGNERFVQGMSVHPDQTFARIKATENGQKPYAVVVTCSDSRVSPEILFDEGIGDLFVIRTAGNLMDDLELGSVEYAVEHLDASLVIILGHTECGAIKAFLSEEGNPPGHIRQVVETIAREKEEQQILNFEGKDLNACIEGNVLHGVRQIKNDEPVLSEKINAHEVLVVPMVYDVHSGRVQVLQENDLSRKHHCDITTHPL